MSSDSIPKIAVLLAAYNGLKWLPDQVPTILNQRDVSVSLFVSVDRSNDGTEEWFDRLAAKDSRVKVLPHGRKFGGAAKNFFRLISEAELGGCEYVSFADQDDLWSETKLARAAHILNENHCDGYSSNVTAFWPNGRQQLVHKAQAQKRWDYLFEAAGPGCSYVLKRSLLEPIREKILSDKELVNSIYLHDWFCYAFARASDKRWYIDPEPSLFYRQHTSNQFGVNSGVKALFIRISQFSSGFWLDQGALIARVVGVSDTRFVNKWKRLEPLGLIQLAASARRCRRSTRDQVGFFFLCVILAVKKSFTRG
jgi:rhamnosyltransferase